MERPSFTPSTTKGSERGELIQFFVDNLKQRNGKKYAAKVVAIKLAHLKTPDLYYFRSVSNDILQRSGSVAFNKYFWWSLKVK